MGVIAYNSHMSNNKTVVIINSQSSRAQRSMAEVDDLLEKLHIDSAQIHKVKDPTKLEALFIKSFKDTAVDRVVIAGGDGTIIAGIDVAIRRKYKGVIGILPVGTSNYLGRNLHIPTSLEGAAKVLAGDHTRTITLPTAGEKRFALIATVGVSANVSKNISVKFKQKFGQFAYIYEAMRQLSQTEAFGYEITVDTAKKPISGRSRQLLIANASLDAQVAVAPDESIHSSSIMLTIYESRSRFQLLLSLVIYMVTAGRTKYGLKTIKAKSIHIKTSPKLDVDIDGELCGKTPMTIRTTSDSVKILC